MAKIIPSILVNNIDEATKRIEMLPPNIDVVSIDVMDGSFVKPTSFFDISQMSNIDTGALFELDLMVNNPLPIIKQWAKDSRTTRAIVHAELDTDIRELVTQIHNLKLEAGIALLPKTQISDIEHLLNDVDMVLVRGNEPGYSGKEFEETQLKKIVELSEEYPHLYINVDIGVNKKTIPDIITAGATHLSVNSAIYGNDNPIKALAELQDLANS